ncbi:Tim44/TimA family putative adaptor protein [Pararhodospirillum photometricum]|uniref:Tim44-like domain-containing protein n=1 Tax=Pararhodospirillum photometricum DSM 122 TaxID=1150469 RepID=H6SMK9_PARPM|nr:Tim44/TimA family putative adaptor protein [Pararhodospirillum photometricum]CCG09144.1 Putative uncharacterized protein [Pararhodospirillum photometricum DSM 122]
MNDGLQYIDIIFIAMVAAFLVLRLRSVLGRRTGDERKRPNPLTPGEDVGDNVVALPGRAPLQAAGTPGSVAGGLARLRLADPSFSPDAFLQGARSAFQMILMAYAKGDRDTLKPLLSPEVFRNFSGAIEAREKAGETMETDLLSFKDVDFTAVDVRDRDAYISVRFVTEQVNTVRDPADAVVEGNPNHIEVVTDVWTFCRTIGSADPNWELVATQVPEEA